MQGEAREAAKAAWRVDRAALLFSLSLSLLPLSLPHSRVYPNRRVSGVWRLERRHERKSSCSRSHSRSPVRSQLTSVSFSRCPLLHPARFNSATPPPLDPPSPPPSLHAQATMLTDEELEVELRGSLNEVQSIAASVRTDRYAAREEWMQPYEVQVAFDIEFRPPPPPMPHEDESADDERRRSDELSHASTHVCAAMCLPHGYALLERVEATDSGAGSESSSPPPFRFATPLVVCESLHSLLQRVSPVYVAWFEQQMNERLMQLVGRDGGEEDDSNDADKSDEASDQAPED